MSERPQNCGSGFCSCVECPYEPRLVGWLTADNLFTRHEPDDLTGCKEVRVPSIDYPKLANDVQVGGTHYRNKIQPWDYIISHNLNYLEGNIIKYVTRYKGKHGLEDLQKARHYLDKLIETLTEDESWTKQTK